MPERTVPPHVHIGLLGLTPAILVIIAVLGTMHLIAISTDNRASRALLALGF